MTAADRPRGSLLLYALAFALLLGSGLALVFFGRDLFQSTGMLWLSIALSLLAIGTAVAGLFLPRRG